MLKLRMLAALFLLLAVGPIFAEDGPKVGDAIGSFTVEKCAGNTDEGIEVGKSLCYRCKLGTRPVIAVFSKNADEALSDWMTELDALISQHEKAKLASFVGLLGEDTKALKEKATWLVEKSNAKQVSVVLPKENVAGPSVFKLSPKAETSVVLFHQGKVVASFAFAAGELNAENLAKVRESASTMLN